MHIVLDECLPKDLARELLGHRVVTVAQAGWSGVKNGALLRLIAASGKCDVFITMDKSLPQQNKIRELPFAIVVLRAKSNRLEHVVLFTPALLRRLAEFQPGRVHVLTLPV